MSEEEEEYVPDAREWTELKRAFKKYLTLYDELDHVSMETMEKVLKDHLGDIVSELEAMQD